MARSKRKRDDLKDLYRKIRKPVPPPARVEEDRRRKLLEEQAQRESDGEEWERDKQMFEDRESAGRLLGEALAELDLADPVTFGIPRGGVVVAAEVARLIGGELDVIVPMKIRAPHQPELALGAVGPDGSAYLDDETIRLLGVSDDYLDQEIAERAGEIGRRMIAYRGDRDPASVEGRTAIVVDDGIATGSTTIAAARSLKKMSPQRLILAVPVAPRASLARLKPEVDEVVCLATPEPFLAVGRWYRHFDQVSDEQVKEVLQQGVTS